MDADVSLSSDLPTARRVPRQSRGEARRTALLEAAATVIGETGYEAATLTEVAARAGASIGALYQYFPNKEAMANALRVRYDDELTGLWKPLAAGSSQLNVKELVDRMVDVLAEFLEARPAYLPLLGVPGGDPRDPGAKDRLQEHLAALFREKRPDLTPKKAGRVASVAWQVIKGMTILFTQEDERERRKLRREFKLALTAYLHSRLHP